MVPLVYSPRLCFISLQVLMQATQGYAFSGKQSSIDFLITYHYHHEVSWQGSYDALFSDCKWPVFGRGLDRRLPFFGLVLGVGGPPKPKVTGNAETATSLRPLRRSQQPFLFSKTLRQSQSLGDARTSVTRIVVGREERGAAVARQQGGGTAGREHPVPPPSPPPLLRSFGNQEGEDWVLT
jgi:hypothetical protein